MHTLSRRHFLAGAALAPAGQTLSFPNLPPLAANAFWPLPLTAVKPAGWLKRQLQVQADGLTGHLDEFWPDLGRNSGWRGGTGESWERGPYFLDGLIPLAFLLEDARLIAKTKSWVEWTLTHQRPDGGIGPDRRQGKFAQSWQAEDWWPNMVMLKVLTQYQEATGDSRVIPLMTRYFHHHLENAGKVPLARWAAHRSAEEMLCLAWLYNRTGDRSLLPLAATLRRQSFDWNVHFAAFRHPTPVPKAQTNLSTHVVNNAMALKTAAVWWQFSRDAADRQAVYRMLDQLDRHHLQAHGGHSGDEHYAGLDPSRGTELCSIVEAMFSYEQLTALLGDPQFGDRLERLAYNALPGTCKADLWAHQYDQQVNQVLCSVDKSRAWGTNGPDSNIYGLEPNFGCCTANLHQGWPKFVSHLWMATPDQGLAAVAYGPSKVTTPITAIEEDTDYPFSGEVRLTVRPPKPATFPLVLRIPRWAERATLKVNGQTQPPPKPVTFHTVRREWRPGDSVEIDFRPELRTERHYRNSVVVLRGPLLFSLKVGEDWRKIKGEEPHADWEVHPTTPWNYGLIAGSVKLASQSRPENPFDTPPVRLTARARRLPQWKLENAAAGPLPESPATSAEKEETVTLVPYGSARLRVTAFPKI